MVLGDFKEAPNIVTDLHCIKRVVLHIETAKFTPDDIELIYYIFRYKI